MFEGFPSGSGENLKVKRFKFPSKLKKGAKGVYAEIKVEVRPYHTGGVKERPGNKTSAAAIARESTAIEQSQLEKSVGTRYEGKYAAGATRLAVFVFKCVTKDFLINKGIVAGSSSLQINEDHDDAMNDDQEMTPGPSRSTQRQQQVDDDVGENDRVHKDGTTRTEIGTGSSNTIDQFKCSICDRWISLRARSSHYSQHQVSPPPPTSEERRDRSGVMLIDADERSLRSKRQRMPSQAQPQNTQKRTKTTRDKQQQRAENERENDDDDNDQVARAIQEARAGKRREMPPNDLGQDIRNVSGEPEDNVEGIDEDSLIGGDEGDIRQSVEQAAGATNCDSVPNDDPDDEVSGNREVADDQHRSNRQRSTSQDQQLQSSRHSSGTPLPRSDASQASEQQRIKVEEGEEKFKPYVNRKSRQKQHQRDAIIRILNGLKRSLQAGKKERRRHNIADQEVEERYQSRINDIEDIEEAFRNLFDDIDSDLKDEELLEDDRHELHITLQELKDEIESEIGQDYNAPGNHLWDGHASLSFLESLQRRFDSLVRSDRRSRSTHSSQPPPDVVVLDD